MLIIALGPKKVRTHSQNGFFRDLCSHVLTVQAQKLELVHGTYKKKMEVLYTQATAFNLGMHSQELSTVLERVNKHY